MNIMVTQNSEGLQIKWTPPQSTSKLIYTVQYDTVPPSSGALFTTTETQNMTMITEQNLVFDRACSVRVRAMDNRTRLYGSWSYADCFVNATTAPGVPIIGVNGLTYDYPLLVLQWDSPNDTNGFILKYNVGLRNVTAKTKEECNTLCGSGTFEDSFKVECVPHIYEVIKVTASTCFCAAVKAINGAGSSSAAKRFIFYPVIVPTSSSVVESTSETKLVTPTKISDTDRVTATDGCDDDDIPVVAIILGVVLVIVLIVTLVLAVIFIRLYTAQMKQTKGSESSRNLSSSYN